MSSTAEIFAKIESSVHKNPEKATSINAVFQFNITGDSGGSWAIDLREGTREHYVTEGNHDAPSVTIGMSDDTWTGIFSGAVNPMQAFMMGKIKVSGDMGLAMKLQNILSLAK